MMNGYNSTLLRNIFLLFTEKDDNREEIEGTIHSKEKLDFYMLAKYVWTV